MPMARSYKNEINFKVRYSNGSYYCWPSSSPAACHADPRALHPSRMPLCGSLARRKRPIFPGHRTAQLVDLKYQPKQVRYLKLPLEDKNYNIYLKQKIQMSLK